MEQNSTEKLTTSAKPVETGAGSAESAEPIFTRKKSLLTIDQYAVRQGVSSGIVQECSKLGVVQVRRHKDKTFIVDLPLDTYKILKQQQDSPSAAIEPSICSNKITDLVNRILKPENELKTLTAPEKTSDKDEDITGIKTDLTLENSEPIPDLKIFADEETKAPRSHNIEVPDSGFRVTPMRNITDTFRSLSLWKISFVFAAVAFALSFIAYTSVSIERKAQQQKLRQAYDSIDKLMNKYEQTRQKIRTAEFDMLTWRSEAEQTKKAMLNTESELQNTRKNLFEAKKELQSIQENNINKLKELNEQITKIRENIPNTSTQPLE